MTVRRILSRLSISTRLALWYGLSLILLLTLFVVGLYTTVHVGLHRTFDRHLRDEAKTLRTHLQAHGPEIHALSRVEGATGPRASFVRLLAADGDVLHRSSPEHGPVFDPDVPSTRTAETRRHDWNGRAAQTIYLPLTSTHSTARWLEVTKLESGLHHQLHRFRWLLVVGIVLGGGGAVAIGYGLARRALQPVAALTTAARDLQDRPRGTLPTDFGVKDELSDLAETFNDLFRRLRAMVARERRFRANAAHKMFTPLTALQNEIDVTLRRPRSASEYRDTLEAARSHTEELSTILDRLMTLARVEQRERGPAPEDVDVVECVRARVDRVRARAESNGVALAVDAPRNATLPMKPRHLETITDALVDNAIKYTPDGGRVTVTVRAEDDHVVLSVSDTGLGFEEDDGDRLFDRFYRGEKAKSAAPGGGLGLSVVQALARSYGGTVSAQSDGGGTGSTFTVRIPARECP